MIHKKQFINVIMAFLLLLFGIFFKVNGFFWGLQVWSSPILIVVILPVIIAMFAYLLIEFFVFEKYQTNLIYKSTIIIFFIFNILTLAFLNHIYIYYSSGTMENIIYINLAIQITMYIFLQLAPIEGGDHEK